MKLIKPFGIVLAIAMLVFLYACTSGPSVQTTPSAGGMQTTAATTAANGTPVEAQIISYDAHYDEASDLFMYYASTMGELTREVGKISQDDGKGASIITTVGEIEDGKTGADLLEAHIDRSKNILAEFGEDQFAFYETSDNGVNRCYFSIIAAESKTVSFEMTFPTDDRDTYFQHVSMLFQIYLDVYSISAE